MTSHGRDARATFPLLRLAWRLATGRPGLAWLAVACIAVGIAARGAVTGTVGAVAAHAAREARALLAADLEISSGTPLSETVRAAIRDGLPAGARISEARTLTAMAAAEGGATLVELRAIAAGWPLAGSLVSEPATAVDALAGGEPAVLVDPDLLGRLHVAIGDHLRLGAGDFRIAGTVAAEPGAGASFFRFGPRVYAPLAALAGAGLDGAGVRARHLLVAALPDPRTAQAVATALRERLGLPADQGDGAGGGPTSAPVSVRSASEAANQGAHAVEQIADFLRLVALFALALGALGVAALARGMMRLQADDLAMLRVLGATRARAAAAFVLQAIGLGAVGGALGTVLGSGLAAAGAHAMAIGAALPDPRDAAVGIGLGILAAVIAAGAPAIALARMQPLAVLRGDPPALVPSAAGAALLLITALLAVLAAAWEAHSWVIGPAVAAGTALTALALAAAARWLLPPVARLLRHLVAHSFALRHGLANLTRPDRRAGALPVALGLAAALAAALLLLRASITAELAPGRLAAVPAFFAIDVQDDQREAFAALLSARHLPPNLRPLVRARLTAIDGRDSGSAPIGGTREAERAAHFRRREQNLTWAAAPGPGETLIRGRWPSAADEVAVEERWAGRLGVGVGSRLAFDIQGVPVAAVVVGLRRIDWWTFQPNFFICFGPDALAGAPTVWVGAIPAAEASERRQLAAEVARTFPNVSLIDISDAAGEARRVIDRAALAVAGVAAVALLAALAVVAGTAAASARERRGEAALVRALGGRRGTVAIAIASEFAVAALLAALIGSGLGILGGLALATQVLNAATVVPWGSLAALVAGLVVAATATALATARRAWRIEPLAALREE